MEASWDRLVDTSNHLMLISFCYCSFDLSPPVDKQVNEVSNVLLAIYHAWNLLIRFIFHNSLKRLKLWGSEHPHEEKGFTRLTIFICWKFWNDFWEVVVNFVVYWCIDTKRVEHFEKGANGAESNWQISAARQMNWFSFAHVPSHEIFSVCSLVVSSRCLQQVVFPKFISSNKTFLDF